MKPQPPSPQRLGITRRIALLSWLVTIVTLVIFVAVIVPEQKRTYIANLESKARSISASLQEVTAGAVVTEDYSSVVDHCKQVLQGDPSISFLVITKNDGFSLIHQTGGKTNSAAGVIVPLEAQWRTDTLNDYWRPAQRTVLSGIEMVPVFNQRIFHYARPFNYSGIEWGWIHVGLSLEAYDRSVHEVYRRTGLLAMLCLLFSLGASVIYAKRLLQPLHALNQVVRRITAGDLAARADIYSGDEIQELAQSFNLMTDALLQRDRILESVRVAAQQFLSTTDWRGVIDGVLARIGQAAEVSRLKVFQSRLDDHGNQVIDRQYFWAATDCELTNVIGHETTLSIKDLGFGALEPLLQQGKIVSKNLSEVEDPARRFFDSRGIKSMIAVPILVEGSFWGLLTLVDCARERPWTDAERDSLRAASDMLGAAIVRHRTQEALLEAKATLEQRVLERTRELQEQMAAKEKAHAELAQAQQRLLEASRLAGMAEVATGVLHNVGNVLNSVSVSASLVKDHLRRSSVAYLCRAANMLREKHSCLAEYLTSDPKGKLLPEYLSVAADELVKEQAQMATEMTSLDQHIDHIKQIVAMQQSYAKVAGALENLSPAELVEDALRMNAAAFERHRIQVVRELIEQTPTVCVDRHKVLQILINLLRNAKYAMDHQNPQDKRLVVRVETAAPDRVKIVVRDTGIGIPRENLIKVFSHGFTTKRDGHGFGLHSGANAAKEMGGILTAQSAGVGHGATFTLELPTASVARKEGNSIPQLTP